MDNQAEARLIKTQIGVAVVVLFFFVSHLFWGEIRSEFFALWLDIAEPLKGYFIFMKKILPLVVGLYLAVVVFLKTVKVIHVMVLRLKHKKDKNDSFWKYL